MANFFETLVEVLKADERLFSQDGSELLRNKVYELAMAMDAGLLALLLGNEETRSRFFTDVNGTLVFDKMAFGWVVNNRQFLPDSYTRVSRTELGWPTAMVIFSHHPMMSSFSFRTRTVFWKEARRRRTRSVTKSSTTRLLLPMKWIGCSTLRC